MKRVTVHYADGHVVEYDMLRKAAKALGCAPGSIVAFSMGFARLTGARLKAQGIVSVDIEEMLPRRPARPEAYFPGRPVAVVVECMDGRLFSESSIAKAARTTCLAPTTVKLAIGDGRWHGGYRFELADGQDPVVYDTAPIEFGDTPVPDDIIRQLRKMAWHYYKTYWSSLRLPKEDVADIVDHAVAYASADYSKGKFDPSRVTFGVWAYTRVKSYALQMLEKAKRRVKHRFEMPDDTDPDLWIDAHAEARPDTVTDEDYVENLPEEYREIARLLLAGYTRYEICRRLGKPECVLSRVRRLLGEYIRRRRDGLDISDSGRGEETSDCA